MPARKDPPDIDDLRRLIEVETLTHQEVAARYGVSRNTVLKWCRRYSLRTQRTGPRSGPGHPEWKGGRIQRKGYWYIYAPEHPRATKAGYVLEHRLVMEHELGRYLETHEVVHHRDRNRENNAPENLQVFGSNAEHLRHELTGRVPNWTPEGWRRMQQAVRRPRKRRSR